MADVKRRSIRRKSCLKAVIMGRDGICHSAVITDISSGGCRIVTPFRGLKTGDEISILLKIVNKSLELYGRVVHFYPPTKHAVIGIEFKITCIDSYRELVKFIYDNEATQIAVLARAKLNK